MENKSKYIHLLPVMVEVEEGKIYNWCGCGQSSNPPFCNNACNADKAVVFQAELNEWVCLCNCKQSKNPPWCDGSHAKLLQNEIKKGTML